MVDWSRPLTRVLVLKSGERLRTLHDAAEQFTRQFGSVPKSALLEHAIGLLLRAAETGTRADRKAATDQVALVLRFNMMLRFNTPRRLGQIRGGVLQGSDPLEVWTGPLAAITPNSAK